MSDNGRQRELARIYREATQIIDAIPEEVANQIENTIKNPNSRVRRKRPQRRK